MRRASCGDDQFSREMFEAPFELVEAVQLKSASEAAKEIEILSQQLDEKSEWDLKFNAIRRCMSLLKGGVLEYPEFNLNQIVPGIAAVVTDLRSTLVKWGALFSCALSKVLGPKFATFVEIFIPNLFKQATHGTAVISQSCHYAIVEIVSNSPSRKTARCILDKSSDKSSARRFIVAEALRIMTTSWPKNIFTPLQTDISNAITKLRKDASSEVRGVFRGSPAQVLQAPNSGTPPSSALKYTSKDSSRRLSPRIPQISKTPRPSLPAMPTVPPLSYKPHSEADATQVIHTISQQIDSPIPASRKRLLRSIQETFPAAVELTPYDPTLYTIIPKLLRKFKEEMKEVITDILISMELDEKILKAAMNTYSFEILLDLFKREPDKLAFIKHVYISNPELFTVPVVPKLVELRRSIGNDETLNEIITRLTPKKEPLEEIIDRAENNQEYDSMITNVYASVESTKFLNDVNNSKMLPSFLNRNPRLAAELCEQLIKRIPNLSFESSFDIFVNEVNQESISAPICEKIIHAIFEQGLNKKKLSKYITNPGFLVVLANYIMMIGSNTAAKVVEFLPDLIIPQMSHNSITARRAATMCIIYLMKAAGDKFNTDKLNENQKLLISKFKKRLNL